MIKRSPKVVRTSSGGETLLRDKRDQDPRNSKENSFHHHPLGPWEEGGRHEGLHLWTSESSKPPSGQALQLAHLEFYEDRPHEQKRLHIYWETPVPEAAVQSLAPARQDVPPKPSRCDQCSLNSICSNIKLGLTLLESAGSNRAMLSTKGPASVGAGGYQLAAHDLPSGIPLNTTMKHSAKEAETPLQSLPGILHAFKTKLRFYGWNFPESSEICSLRLSPKVLHDMVEQLVQLCHRAHVQILPEFKLVSYSRSRRWGSKLSQIYRKEVSHE